VLTASRAASPSLSRKRPFLCLSPPSSFCRHAGHQCTLAAAAVYVHDGLWSCGQTVGTHLPPRHRWGQCIFGATTHCSLTSNGMDDRMASFSLNTGMTFIDSRSSAVAVSASRKPAVNLNSDCSIGPSH
jgi:hypothetical protein